MYSSKVVPFNDDPLGGGADLFGADDGMFGGDPFGGGEMGSSTSNLTRRKKKKPEKKVDEEKLQKEALEEVAAHGRCWFGRRRRAGEQN